jgi:tetratricopeptide (TPR) repeat protein
MTSVHDVADEPWGHRLRRWRSDTMNWSQEEFVGQVVRLAFERNEERGTSLDVRLVSRWESGHVKRPQGVYRRLLGHLGAPPPDAPARTAPRLPGSCPVEPPEESIASLTTGDGFDLGDGDPSVQRRDFLRAGSSLAISGLLAAVVGDGSGATHATPDVVDELARRLVSLRKLDDTLGGGDTYRLYAAEAELTGHLLRGGVHRDAVHRGLLALHAEQSQQAGWAAFDAGWHDMAREHYRHSHAAATEAGDAGLAGNALAFHAYQLLALGKPARAESDRSVHAADQPGVDPGVGALLYSRAAWTFALDGDADATARCLGRAEEALALADGRTPDYAAWIDQTELAIMTGRCWSELRRPLRAVPVLERALAGYSDAHSRDKALYSSWLADSYLDAGEIEQATTVVQSSLAVMGNTSSVRPRERLVKVAGRLAEHGDLPVVRGLLGSHALHPLDVRR